MNDMEDVFYWGVCPVCKCDDMSKVKRCARCRLIYYCSREHQKIHWPNHKDVCKSVSGLPEVFEGASECCCAKEWNEVRVEAGLLTELKMGRKLSAFERQMFLFPKVCEVCKSPKATVDCEKCLCVSYCSAQHCIDDVPHADRCSDLALCRRLDLHIRDNTVQVLQRCVVMNVSDRSFPLSIKDFLSDLVFTSKESDAVPGVSLISEFLSCPLTVISVLKQLPFNRSSLTVHVVGAGGLECRATNVWELLLHWLPSVTALSVVFVGPETQQMESTFSQCKICLKTNKTIALQFHKGFYHEFCASEQYLKPDVITVFNCGFMENSESENDTWCLSLPCFFKSPNAIVIFTSYTQVEAQRDFDILTSNCGNNEKEVKIKKAVNPFASLRPHRDWDQFRTEIFFFNRFMSVIKVKK